MAEHDIEIEISPDGTVKARTKGVTGEGCQAYAKLIEEIVGRISQRELTEEAHLPDQAVVIAPLQQRRIRR